MDRAISGGVHATFVYSFFYLVTERLRESSPSGSQLLSVLDVGSDTTPGPMLHPLYASSTAYLNIPIKIVATSVQLHLIILAPPVRFIVMTLTLKIILIANSIPHP